MSTNGQRYDVGGVLLERPFKIRRLGHFGFNVTKVEACREFYGDLLGFTVSDKADFSRAPWFPKGQDLGPRGISCATAATITRWCCSRSQ